MAVEVKTFFKIGPSLPAFPRILWSPGVVYPFIMHIALHAFDLDPLFQDFKMLSIIGGRVKIID